MCSKYLEILDWNLKFILIVFQTGIFKQFSMLVSSIVVPSFVVHVMKSIQNGHIILWLGFLKFIFFGVAYEIN